MEADEQGGADPEDGASDEQAPPRSEVFPDRFASLTPQERRLLNLVADGLTDKEIADRLSLSERAANRYVDDLVSKLGLETRTQAILFAINRAFRAPDPSRERPSEDAG
jgi:DNA-binding NarL/FixJ family response regulator